MKVATLVFLSVVVGGTFYAFSRVGPNLASKRPARYSKGAEITSIQSKLGSQGSSDYEIVAEFVRPDLGYTEGLSFKDGLLVESTGNYGDSRVQYMRLNEDTKEVEIIKKFSLPSEYFGEGHALLNINGEIKLVMMTYQAKLALQLDKDLTRIEKVFKMPSIISEGWGMTSIPGKPHMVYVSDGSSHIHMCDASNDLQIVNSFNIRDSMDFMYLFNINELEYVKGKIYANVYMQDYIAVIDLELGKAIKTFSMVDIKERANQVLKQKYGRYLQFDEVLNGIAYNEEKDTFYVTGKHWPLIFEVKFKQ